ncbi:uncharacterized protein LOC106674023 [Cimex lectularius]|uniref:Protein sleepless n=1 Tax=Cimex lectularius TaxID=79782 RepID=A0A8I6TLH6_CIMLE|nr:uncharacterized protein LOC106674023 [Cimex lectularius]
MPGSGKREIGAILLAAFLAQIGCGIEARAEVTTPAEQSWIMCYQCNSEYDPRCGDPFDPYSLGKVNCSLVEPLEHLPGQRPSICRKNVQKVYGKIRVVRGCGYIQDSNLNAEKCLYRSGTYNVHAQYCSCTGDLCNSANQAVTSALLISFLTVAAIL